MSAYHFNYLFGDKGKGLAGWSCRQSSHTYTHLSYNGSPYHTRDESLIEQMADRKQHLIKTLIVFREWSLAGV